MFPGINGSDFYDASVFYAVQYGDAGLLDVGGRMDLRERLFHPVAGGVKIISDGMFTRVRLPQFAAAWWGLGVTGGLGFASTFILGFSTDMQPPITLALATTGVVYLSGAGAYLWQRWKIASGIDDLVINARAREPSTCP